MSKVKIYDIDDEQEICLLGKALSSPERIKIIKLLAMQTNLIISDIAKSLSIPQSSVAFHLKILDEAGIIRMEERPGKRGTSKLCSNKLDYINVWLTGNGGKTDDIYTLDMPVGNYMECQAFPTCGLSSKSGVIGMEDQVYSFYLPQRQNAGILWTSRGHVSYRFANQVHEKAVPREIIFSMEICSEAPGYNEDWKSDITFWINGVECTTWTCPGDFGRMRGRLNPPGWGYGQTQYGILVVLDVRQDGCYFNEEKVSDVTVDTLALNDQPYVDLKIGNKEDAHYVGGFNLFGKDFGNHEQGIVMTIGY